MSLPQQPKPSLFTPLRVALTVLVLTLIATIGVSSCNSTDRSAVSTRPTAANPITSSGPTTTSPVVLPTVPENVLNADLKSVSGDPIRLANYSGKVLVVNLWATWCGPCRNEIPELVRLHKEYREKGVEMVGLSTENPEASEESVKKFVQDLNVDYRIGWATSDVAVTLMQGRDAIPQSFVISRDGHILKRFVGFSITNTPPQMKQAIEDALKS
jgi:thiol-disulfide isomerase/thioredoxin